jgi:FkbM family methyltransferase
MSKLDYVSFAYETGATKKPVTMAFDRAFPTQNFLHSFLSRGELPDPPLVAALTEFLEPGDTFVDVGSHVGYYAMLASQHVGEQGRVFAFEPSPQTFGVLLANTILNGDGRCRAFNCALGDKAGVAPLFIDRNDEGMSSLATPSKVRGGNAADGAVSVFVSTIDALYEQLQWSAVRTIKIDVEGFEPHVIRGADDFLRKHLPENIVFEINNSIPDIPLHQDMPIRQRLAELGYTSYLIRPWATIDAAAHDSVKHLFGDSNYLGLPLHCQLNIGYGNILSTRRQLDAPHL